MSARTNAPHHSFMEGKWHTQAAALFRANSGISAVGLKWSSNWIERDSQQFTLSGSVLHDVYIFFCYIKVTGRPIVVSLSTDGSSLWKAAEIAAIQETETTTHRRSWALTTPLPAQAHLSIIQHLIQVMLAHWGILASHWTWCFRLPHLRHL